MPKVHSAYLVKNFSQKKSGLDLYSYVKFGLLAEELKRQWPGSRPLVLDLGCAKRETFEALMSHNGYQMEYIGVDREESFQPDIVADIKQVDRLLPSLPRRPDVILLLDVLEHLEGKEGEILQTLEACRKILHPKGKVFVVAPQNYRLDQFKLSHLYYPEHKVRLHFREWQVLLESQFRIVSTRGIGYLSVLPYLLMAYPGYQENNAWGRLFHYVRDKLMIGPLCKHLDLGVTRLLNRVTPLRILANGVFFELSLKEKQQP